MTPPAHVDSYYAATANPAPEHAVLEGEITCDVCVVGAGFTGISTALNLAEKGFDVVVIEAARVGWGASGRNGGQVGSGYVTGMRKIARWVGEDDARKLWHMAEEAKAIIIDRTARHGIRCDLRWGFLLAATKPGEMKGLAEWVDSTAQTYGYDKLALPRPACAARAAGQRHLPRRRLGLGFGPPAPAQLRPRSRGCSRSGWRSHLRRLPGGAP